VIVSAQSILVVSGLLLTALALCGCDHTDRVCRMNDGWPCSCDDPGGTCRDGSPCVNLAIDFPQSAPSAEEGPLGYCAFPCPNPEIDLCPETGFGLNASCFTQTVTDEIFLCILYCEDDRNCPPKQICTAGNYCHPAGELD
jgi:hypothetical protein